LHVAVGVLLQQEALLDEAARGVVDGADESVLAPVAFLERRARILRGLPLGFGLRARTIARLRGVSPSPRPVTR
jgi:hypothetical protein